MKNVLKIICMMLIALFMMTGSVEAKGNKCMAQFKAGRAVICMNVWDYFSEAAAVCNRAESVCALMNVRDEMWKHTGCDEVLPPEDIRIILQMRADGDMQ